MNQSHLLSMYLSIGNVLLMLMSVELGYYYVVVGVPLII